MLHLYNWSTRSDLNRRTRDLQSPPLGHSGTCALLFGSGGGNRTPTNGFGDRRTAIILHRNWQGYQDSNLKRHSQSVLCCQLHHTPIKLCCYNFFQAISRITCSPCVRFNHRNNVTCSAYITNRLLYYTATTMHFVWVNV